MSGRDDAVGFERLQSRDAERIALGAALATLRIQRGITGSRLGQLAGMSQAKISKIENGVVTPSAGDVERLTAALEVPPEVARTLVSQVENLRDGFVRRRIAAGRLAAAQQETAHSEARARVIRNFQSSLVPGLLQTADYARVVIGDHARLYAGRSDDVPPNVAGAVAARLQRQEVLESRSKRFVFVLTEVVLMNRLCAPSVFGAQIARLRAAATQDNVTVRIVPRNAELDYPPLHGFQIFDDDTVVIDMINSTLSSRGTADLRVYRAAFDYFHRAATDDIEPILDRYDRLYAGLALAALSDPPGA
jgi:transcriptional regulator with XRE-family HTH domain